MHDRVERHFVGETADGIAWATLNRPKQMNAFSDQMRDDLIAFLSNVEHDPSVRCVVLRGAGNHFMAGGDIKSFTEHMALDAEARRAQNPPPRFRNGNIRFPVPARSPSAATAP